MTYRVFATVLDRNLNPVEQEVSPVEANNFAEALSKVSQETTDPILDACLLQMRVTIERRKNP